MDNSRTISLGRIAAICRLWHRVTNLNADQDSDCGICQEPYALSQEQNGEIPMRLSCNHIFGAACLQTWLSDTHTCPTCRRDYSEELSSAQNTRSVSAEDDENHPFLPEDYAAAERRMVRHVPPHLEILAKDDFDSDEEIPSDESDNDPDGGPQRLFVFHFAWETFHRQAIHAA